jgi:hypothetical protein
MLTNWRKSANQNRRVVNGAPVQPTSAHAVLTFLVFKKNTTFLRVAILVQTAPVLKPVGPNSTVFFDIIKLRVQ